MHRVALILLMMLTPANAGPWMRAPGSAFLSYSVESAPPDIYNHAFEYTTFYTEFGLTKRLTFGLESGKEHDRTTKDFVFLRMPMGNTTGPLRIAAELAFGQSDGTATLRPGISVGRNFQIGQFKGWFATDTRYILKEGKSFQRVETDMTIGVNTSPKTKLLLQMQTGAPKYARPYIKFSPSFVVSRKNGSHTEIGVVAGISNAPGMSLKIGTWQSF